MKKERYTSFYYIIRGKVLSIINLTFTKAVIECMEILVPEQSKMFYKNHQQM